MGIYIDKGNFGFRQSRNSEYVDKSGLIAVVNQTLFTRQKFTCVTRSRRFGKSMAAEMLAAYYDRSCDSRPLFADLQIAQDPTFEEHLNKYPVIYLDLSGFARKLEKGDVVDAMEKALIADIRTAYPKVAVPRGGSLMDYLMRVHTATCDTFIFIIDEWDAILREESLTPGPSKSLTPGPSPKERGVYTSSAENTRVTSNHSPLLGRGAGGEALGGAGGEAYINWLRSMFKDVLGMEVFAGVYMTGILPIKKYKTQSAMNNFFEYSMVEPRKMASFFGFTKEEVKALAAKHGMDFDELEKWYDGYQIGPQPSMFNPNSVMQAVDIGRCRSFWASTGTFDSISGYINMNFDGLKEDIIEMLAGGRVKVDPTGFQNDLSEVHSRDDVLTVLIHLGYLSYDWRRDECFIPNREVAGEMVNAIKSVRWTSIVNALQQSERLLEATLRGDEQTVARMVAEAHTENASIIRYSDENSMACVLSIAYYYAHGDYIFHREYQTGLGFADLVLMPRKNTSTPAIIVELKYNDTADTAIDQIHHGIYDLPICDLLFDRNSADIIVNSKFVNCKYNDILLVGISYDKKAKEHQCRIERIGLFLGSLRS